MTTGTLASSDLEPVQALPPAARRRGRRTLLLLALVCVLPVLASYAMFYLWQPEGRVNNGSLLQPVLRRLFPRASRDAQTLDALSMNVSANLLGLGNAATPAGVRAAQAMARELRGSKASDELCLLVVLNTASIQLLPVTIAAVREAAGAAVPFDILPAVWVTSLCSVTVGLLTGKGLARIWR